MKRSTQELILEALETLLRAEAQRRSPATGDGAALRELANELYERRRELEAERAG